jgi:hypothetical protein
MKKTTTYHDFHGFKWKKKKNPILNFFFGDLTPFLACWIMTTPIDIQCWKMHYNIFFLKKLLKYNFPKLFITKKFLYLMKRSSQR